VTIPKDPKAQACKSIGSATQTAGGTAGSQITAMVGQLAGMLLSKSIIGDVNTIDTPAIKVFTKMASGEGAKDPMSILNTGVIIDLPSSFCLQQQTPAGICNAPVGISAIVYKQNPIVSITKFFLSFVTSTFTEKYFLAKLVVLLKQSCLLYIFATSWLLCFFWTYCCLSICSQTQFLLTAWLRTRFY
jgi:hypothetical protein